MTVRGSATFDRTRRYRYSLQRLWDPSRRRVTFVMLNPSRADARRDDPTIRRCLGFSRQWGFGALEVVNLFAWRTRHPRELRAVEDPVGPRCDVAIRRAAARSALVVVAWGAAGSLGERDAALSDPARRRRLVGDHALVCLGTTRGGAPRHPLYLPSRTAPEPWI